MSENITLGIGCIIVAIGLAWAHGFLDPRGKR